jgi:hypothetical protein
MYLTYELTLGKLSSFLFFLACANTPFLRALGIGRYPFLEQGVCHIVALPFTLKSILMQKKNYGNSNISPSKNIIFKKSPKKNQNPSR